MKKGARDKVGILVSEKNYDMNYKYQIYKRHDESYQIYIFKLLYDDEIDYYYWEEEHDGSEIHLCDSLEKAMEIADELVSNIRDQK